MSRTDCPNRWRRLRPGLPVVARLLQLYEDRDDRGRHHRL